MTAAQRDILSGLVDAQIDAVVAELAREAAASDDVADAAGGRAWITDRVAGYHGLISDDLLSRIVEAAERAIAAWG